MIEACPTCERRISKPIGPHIASTPWADGCACSDRATCIGHQLGSDGPVRPTKEEMMRRATERHDSQMARYEHQCATIAAQSAVIAAAELRALRLSAEDVEALRDARLSIDTADTSPVAIRALAVLARLIGGGE